MAVGADIEMQTEEAFVFKFVGAELAVKIIIQRDADGAGPGDAGCAVDNDRTRIRLLHKADNRVCVRFGHKMIDRRVGIPCATFFNEGIILRIRIIKVQEQNVIRCPVLATEGRVFVDADRVHRDDAMGVNNARLLGSSA